MVTASSAMHPSRSIASVTNSSVLIAALLTFPLILRWSGALSVANIAPQSPQHTQAFLKFCFIVIAFLWGCFTIAVVGIRQRGEVRWGQVVAAQWNTWRAVLRDLGIAAATLIAMVVIGNLSNAVLAPLQRDDGASSSMFVAQNMIEAVAFLIVALTAGFVEEFIFRGYIQRQCYVFLRSTVAASALQVVIFTQGHFYQGWVRLIPVLLIGALLTLVALWRKTLVPGMIAHGLGDGLVAFSYFAKHL